MNDTDERAPERATIGQALNDLRIARHIENYYWARGEWHIILPKGHRLAVPEAGIGLWLSGFRCGLRAKSLS